jgi:hypothetical protein
VYDQTGVLGSNLNGDYHASFTDAQGNTSSVYCTSTSSNTDCNEGTGMMYWVTLPNKRRLYFTGIDPAVDLDHSDGVGGFAIVSMLNDPLSSDSKGGLVLSHDGQVIRFRFRTVQFRVAVFHYFCMPINVDLQGKKRDAYAKHHSMEACHKYQE